MLRPVQSVGAIAVIGNGLMGQGIAQVFARAGKRVTLIGRNPASLDKAMAVIARNVDAFVERGLVDRSEADATRSRISISTRIEDASAVDHVIEAVPAVPVEDRLRHRQDAELLRRHEAAHRDRAKVGGDEGRILSVERRHVRNMTPQQRAEHDAELREYRNESRRGRRRG